MEGSKYVRFNHNSGDYYVQCPECGTLQTGDTEQEAFKELLAHRLNAHGVVTEPGFEAQVSGSVMFVLVDPISDYDKQRLENM